MWVYRLGAEKAKRMLLTGDLITGAEAKEMGLVLDAVPEGELDGAVSVFGGTHARRTPQSIDDAEADDQSGL